MMSFQPMMAYNLIDEYGIYGIAFEKSVSKILITGRYSSDCSDWIALGCAKSGNMGNGIRRQVFLH